MQPLQLGHQFRGGLQELVPDARIDPLVIETALDGPREQLQAPTCPLEVVAHVARSGGDGGVPQARFRSPQMSEQALLPQASPDGGRGFGLQTLPHGGH